MIGEPSDAAYQHAVRLIIRALERIARDEEAPEAQSSRAAGLHETGGHNLATLPE
jgi:hypothetical protein